jgi:hypothetical protein
MRDLITLIESSSSQAEYIKATSWEVLPRYLARNFPQTSILYDWGMCGTGVGGNGYGTRVWPMEFDSSRWSDENHEETSNWAENAAEGVIDAIQYVTPSRYSDKVGGKNTQMYFKIEPHYQDDGKVSGGYVFVVPASEVKRDTSAESSFERKFNNIVQKAERIGGIQFVVQCGELFDSSKIKTRAVIEQARGVFSKLCESRNIDPSYYNQDPYKVMFESYLFKYFFDDKTFKEYLEFLIHTGEADPMTDLIDAAEQRDTSRFFNTPEKLLFYANAVKKTTGDIRDFSRLTATMSPEVIKMFIDGSIANMAYTLEEVDSLGYAEEYPEVKEYIDSLKAKYGKQIASYKENLRVEAEKSQAEREERRRRREEEAKYKAEIERQEQEARLKWHSMTDDERTQHNLEIAKQQSANHPARKWSDEQLTKYIQNKPTDLFNLPVDMRTPERWLEAARIYPKILDVATQPGLRDRIESQLELERIKKFGDR